MPGVDGAADGAVPARAPGVRRVPRAAVGVPGVPLDVLVGAQPRHGGRGRGAAIPVPPRLRPRGAPAQARAPRGQLRRAPLPVPAARLRHAQAPTPPPAGHALPE